MTSISPGKCMIAMAFLGLAGVAQAKLPPPTPEQAQAAAAKKAQAAAQTDKEKKELAESMDKVTARWRSRANANGWDVYSPVSTGSGAAPAPTSSAAPAVRSEKLGTAPPSEDVKDPSKKGK